MPQRKDLFPCLIVHHTHPFLCAVPADIHTVDLSDKPHGMSVSGFEADRRKIRIAGCDLKFRAIGRKGRLPELILQMQQNRQHVRHRMVIHRLFPSALGKITAHVFLPVSCRIFPDLLFQLFRRQRQKVFLVILPKNLLQAKMHHAAAVCAGHLHFLPLVQPENVVAVIQKRTLLIALQRRCGKLHGIAQVMPHQCGIRNGKQRFVFVVPHGKPGQSFQALGIDRVIPQQCAHASSIRRLLGIILHILIICRMKCSAVIGSSQ